MIEIDITANIINVLVSDEELESRRKTLMPFEKQVKKDIWQDIQNWLHQVLKAQYWSDLQEGSDFIGKKFDWWKNEHRKTI